MAPAIHYRHGVSTAGIWTRGGVKVRTRTHKRCALCEQYLPIQAFRLWRPSYCRGCWIGYITFRRSRKAETGVWPNIAEFRSEENQ